VEVGTSGPARGGFKGVGNVGAGGCRCAGAPGFAGGGAEHIACRYRLLVAWGTAGGEGSGTGGRVHAHTRA